MIQTELELGLLLEAFELLDERLLPGRDPDYRHVNERRFDHLADLGIRDEYTRERLLRQRAPTRSVIERAAFVAKSVFDMERGQPVLHHDQLSLRLSRFLDPDLLICLHPDFKPARHDDCDWAATPALSACGFSTNLGPTVETHLHLGGALPPLYSWCLAMTGNFRLKGLSASLVGGDFERLALWCEALNRAAWLRLALANRLREAARPDPFCHLKPPAQVQGYLEGLQALELGRVPEPFREIAFRFIRPRPHRLSRPPFSDCLRDETGHYAKGERRLMIGIAAHQEAFTDEPWATRLLHYIRIRNAFHRLLAYEEGDSGLFRFSESSSQRRSFAYFSPFNRRRREMQFERHRLATALDVQLRQPFERDAVLAGKHRLELRCSLGHRGSARNQLNAWLAGVQDFLHQLRGVNCTVDPDFERFVKHHQAEHPWISKIVERLRLPPVPCPVGIVLQLHKVADHRKDLNLQHVQVFTSLAASFPALRPLLVGIDTAGRERTVEPRRLSQAYCFLQAFEDRFRKAPGEDYDVRWGYTYHVGEDTDDFLIGLRHVDEVVQLLLPERGGRIGHGLILGEDPELFYRKRGLTRPQSGAYLLSLVWAWAVLQDAGMFDAAQRVHQHLVAQIPKLEEVDLNACARQLLDREAVVWRPNLAVPGFSCNQTTLAHAASEEQLLATLLNGEKPRSKELTISPGPRDFDLLREIQQVTRQRLLKHRLTIEINPTSNLLVGGYACYGDLPYRAMSDAGLELSINTDDPGMFTTSLANEMTLLYRGMMAGGAKDPDTRRWLDQMRENGLRSTFLPHPLPLHCDPTEAKRQRARLFAASFM